ncbi:MAG: cytochrome C [Geobacteraceae bacterium GWC2_58_44]|nr:MAG: cytochrome C [Geobacteraceae bacterium GWC2_58_44]HBG05982.1 cytochrome C [Geobacter sp.]
MFLNKRSVAAFLLLGLVTAPWLAPGKAEAIPAFSRQHKTECSTCHTIYPELNEFGDAFLKNSYLWPGRKGAIAPKGDQPEQSGAKGGPNEWAWISGLPEQIPISFTGTADLAYDNDALDGNQLDLSARSLRLHAGGAFREAAGFFLTYNLYSQEDQSLTALRGGSSPIGNPANSSNTPQNNTPNISEMFLLWRHALDTPVNLKVGRFEPKLSLWKRSNRVILVPSYASTAYSVGNSPFSPDAPEDGVEVTALIGNRLLLAGGVVDRNGQNHKDGYGHASLKIGGTDFKGHEPEVDLENDSVWDYLTITLGAFGYSGRNGQFDTLGIARNLNEFYRVGGEIDVLYKRLHLKGGGTFGRDTNPLFAGIPAEFEGHAYAVEGEYYLGAPVDLIPLFRYEYQEGLNGGTRRYIPALAYAPLQNTRLSLQYIHTEAPEGTNKTAFASLAFSL